MKLSDPLTTLRLVGPQQKKFLNRLGLKTIKDLLFYFPRRYEDLSRLQTVNQARPNQTVTLRAKITSIENSRSPRKRMLLTQALLADETGAIEAIWFNQPYILKALEKGTLAIFTGKVVFDRRLHLIISNPAFEIIKRPRDEQIKTELIHAGRIVPIYPATQGVSSRYLRFLVQQALPQAEKLDEWIPASLLCQERLPAVTLAIRDIHFPKNQPAIVSAQKRMAFGELLLLQLYLQSLRLKRAYRPALAVSFAKSEIQNFVKSLPFALTKAQRRVAWQIIKDLEKNKPMYRLLEGDVGSGKTVVAALAALNAACSHYQSVFLAPTGILAQQHFATLRQLFRQLPITIVLLTRSEQRLCQKGRRRKIAKEKLLTAIRKGAPQIIVGTHALLQEKVKFSHIALLVVDEQHRFGVEQRALLEKNQGYFPHFLSMTATPIPRTLALTLYGDLALSVLDELPPGRRPVKTRIVLPEKRAVAYRFIAGQIRQGRQAFVICPLIDPSDKLEVRSATTEYERLAKTVFPDFRIGLLHGKMKAADKEKTMLRFLNGQIDILVATSVIEVGIDVPNATVIAIEGADRFGLAQLHQFRGRVGRGRHAAYCLVFTDHPAQQSRQRLRAFVKTRDGFALAEKDLKLRGPGQFFGTRQSGLPDIPMASLADINLIRRTRRQAQTLLKNSPRLSAYPVLKKKLTQFMQNVHLE